MIFPVDKKSPYFLPLILGILVALIYIPLWGWTVHIAHEQLATQAQMHRQDIMPVLGLEDSLNYSILANNLLDHHVFSAMTHKPFFHETFRVPGYPLFIAAFKWVFGSYLAATFFQILLTFGTGLFIFFLGKKLHSATVGMVAAILFLINPVVIQYTLLIMSDTVFVFLLTWAVYLYMNARQEKLWLSTFSIGLILGVATLCRPILMYFIVPLVALELFRNYATAEWYKRIFATFFLCLGFTACLLPWMIRNKVESGVFALSSIPTYNLLAFNLPGYYLYHDGVTEQQSKNALFKESGGIDEDQSRMLEYGNNIGPVVMRHLKKDLIPYTYYHIAKVTSFFFSSSYESVVSSFQQMDPYRTSPVVISHDPHLSDLLARHDWGGLVHGLVSHIPALVERLFWGIMFIFALGTLYFYRRNPSVWMYAGLIAYLAVVTGPVANARYRLPGMPFLFLLGVLGITSLITCVKEKRKEVK